MFRLAILAWFLFHGAVLAAEVTPPRGWEVKADMDAMTWLKPSASGDTNVGIAFDHVDSATGPLSPWFNSQIEELAKVATISDRKDRRVGRGLMTSSFFLEQSGELMRAYVFAYQTAKGKQVVMVATSETIETTDPVLREALQIVEDAYKQQAYFADYLLFALRPVPARPAKTP